MFMKDIRSSLNKDFDSKIEDIVDSIISDYDKGRDIDRMDFFGQPDQDAVVEIIRNLLKILFPGFYRDTAYRASSARSRLTVLIDQTLHNLRKQIEIVLINDPAYREVSREERKEAARDIAIKFFSKIPEVRALLETDIDATYDGDPAARDKIEIIIAYPGLFATTIHRLAHELYLLDVPYIPRIMSEYAHSETGVDIHPGATIGKYFFIDHATGIVIGETSQIGEHVKIYQGVTIGALSLKDGQALQGVKRHPTIQDYVTLYAGCAVLGGNTVIGHHSVIGGSAFLTKSVAPYSQVSVTTETTVVSSSDEE